MRRLLRNQVVWCVFLPSSGRGSSGQLHLSRPPKEKLIEGEGADIPVYFRRTVRACVERRGVAKLECLGRKLKNFYALSTVHSLVHYLLL